MSNYKMTGFKEQNSRIIEPESKRTTARKVYISKKIHWEHIVRMYEPFENNLKATINENHTDLQIDSVLSKYIHSNSQQPHLAN